MARKKTVEVEANAKSFQQAQAFVEEALQARRVNANMASETMLLFEAVFNSILVQECSGTGKLELSSEGRFGGTEIRIGFEGKRFSTGGGDVSSDPEAKIMEALSDKLSCSYRAGYNIVKISVHQSAKSFIIPNLIAIILAIIVYVPIALTLDVSGQQSLSENWISPLERLFTNLALMIGAPMTFFSLLKNTTDSFILSERNSSARSLSLKSLFSSVVAIVMAFIMGFAIARMLLSLSGSDEVFDVGLSGWSLSSAVDHILPSSILEPFETISPVPMILVALLVTYALCSVGPDFELLKRAINACYSLFSRILRIVMAAFPVACFILFLDLLLTGDIETVIAIGFLVLMVYLCTVPLLATYAIRLRACGINVREFTRKLLPLLKENLAIGSVIDAGPYNIRYCAKNLGISRQRLEKELPVMAQTNLDGNCFIIMLTAVFYVFLANCEVSWINVTTIGLIVLFLSFGAPNQPGSILIGMLIILAYLNSGEAVALPLFFELFCGGLQNILNVISGVVTVAENEAREEKRRLKN